jgi:cell division protein FtsB
MSPRHQVLLALLALALVLLQARLWIGEGSLRHVAQLRDEVEILKKENERLRERNALITADVESLKTGLDTVEGIARKDLGMIRSDETFYILVDDEGAPADE